jgi:hypothetical protein
MPLLLPPSTSVTIEDAAIGTVGSIPPPLRLTITTIAAVNDRHRHCHTVNNNNCQKPAVVVCHSRRQWQSLLTEAAA